MASIKKLMMFIIRDGRRQKYSTSDDRNLARDILTDLGNWSKSYINQIGIESAKKRIKHAESLVDFDKVNKASNQNQMAVEYFKICKSPEFVLTSRRFSIMRAFLLFNINLRNGNRAGVLAEMTVENFKWPSEAITLTTVEQLHDDL